MNKIKQLLQAIGDFLTRDVPRESPPKQTRKAKTKR